MSKTRVTLEELKGKVYIIRVYEKGIEPVAPNPYKFCVVADVVNSTATIKGMMNSNIDSSDYKQIRKELKSIGVTGFLWVHKGKKVCGNIGYIDLT